MTSSSQMISEYTFSSTKFPSKFATFHYHTWHYHNVLQKDHTHTIILEDADLEALNNQDNKLQRKPTFWINLYN